MDINEDDIHWYVFSISFKKEIEIRDQLQALGFDAYVPMHFRLQTIHGRRVRRQEPAVYGLVFVKGSRKDLLEFRETNKLKGYMFLKSRRTMEGNLEYVYIRNKEMENFRKLNEIAGEELTYYKPEELRLAKGEKVKIMDGPFEGIVGTIQKLPHKRGQYLIVSLPNVAIAAVSIKPDYVKPITHQIRKSTDVEKDCKLMSQLALRLITDKDIPNKTVLINEINQIKESLEGCKVFLPNDKANYYFAFYAAALVTEDKTEEYKKQLKQIMPKLKSNNLLLPTSHLLFYYEQKDEKEKIEAENIIGKWNKEKYSEPQKQVIKLQRAVRLAIANDANSKQK